jgi:hypothetical protein
MKLASLVVATLAVFAAASPDVVTLKDGKKLEGRVVRDTKSEVVVRKGSHDKRVDATDVAAISSAARKLGDALAAWDKLSPADSKAICDLANLCRAQQLEGEARVFALFGLTLTPRDEELHEIAGHQKRGESWQVRRGNKREAFDKLVGRELDWDEAWELRTTHFEVRCNLGLRDSVACAIELELVYRAFFAWFAEHLPLYEPHEPMKAHIYASSSEFPEVSSRRAYFEPSGNVLHVNAEGGLDLGALAHEATHQLLFNTSSNTRAALGAIPAWLDEGLADYMASCREGPAARAYYSLGKLNEQHFATHRKAEKPYGLSRVLTMNHGDFVASTNAALKYAQSYTLVHFCLHGQGDEQRERFYDFFRRAYAGKSSMTDFKDAIGVKERDFEAAWGEYVANEG